MFWKYSRFLLDFINFGERFSCSRLWLLVCGETDKNYYFFLTENKRIDEEN